MPVPQCFFQASLSFQLQANKEGTKCTIMAEKVQEMCISEGTKLRLAKKCIQSKEQ